MLDVDPVPMLYAYRMEAPRPAGGTHRTIGVIGALALPGPGVPGEAAADDVLPHERTLPKAKSDRLALLRATRANFDPIWGLTLSTGLTELVAETAAVAAAVDATGVRHELGLISEPDRIEAIRSLVRAQAVVLADGHHRFETACTYHVESPDEGAGAILCLVVELDDAQLDVRPFHRLVSGAPEDLRARLIEDGALPVHGRGAVTPAGLAALIDEMGATGSLGLVDQEGLAMLGPVGEPGAARVRGAAGAAARRRCRALRRRGAPASRRRRALLPKRHCRGARRARVGCGERRDPAAGGHGLADPRRPPRPACACRRRRPTSRRSR